MSDTYILFGESQIPIQRVMDAHPDLPTKIDWFQVAFSEDVENWVMHFAVTQKSDIHAIVEILQDNVLTIASNEHDQTRVIKCDSWLYRGSGVFSVEWQQPRQMVISTR